MIQICRYKETKMSALAVGAAENSTFPDQWDGVHNSSPRRQFSIYTLCILVVSKVDLPRAPFSTEYSKLNPR